MNFLSMACQDVKGDCREVPEQDVVNIKTI